MRKIDIELRYKRNPKTVGLWVNPQSRLERNALKFALFTRLLRGNMERECYKIACKQIDRLQHRSATDL